MTRLVGILALAGAVGACGGNSNKDGGDDAGEDAGETCTPEGDCMNGGLCVFDDGELSCLCDDTGYTGDTCEEDIDECETDDDCDELAECTNTPGSFTCACLFGLEGDGTACGPPASSGVCQIRDSSTSAPNASAPPVGTGYAKHFISGENTIDGLRTACTPAIYDALVAAYCVSNSNDVQRQVLTYNVDGTPNSTGCDDIGCDFVSCPP